uniref:Trans-1,2-dihydrobenzene-1,2-diol dehydrogenase n=2 Tax=Acrobeloides nanus TaxID=290746 RepID=A0A914EDM4_9BILA
MAELKWGVLGCGLISEDFVRAMRQCQHKHKVVAAGASSTQRAQQFVDKCELTGAKVYDYEGVLNDPNVDVVYIGLMNHQHKEWCLKAFDHGKPVLCEKPLAPNYKGAKEIVDKAKEKKLFFMEAFWSRCFPAYKFLREEIDKQAMGPVKSVFANFGLDILGENRFNADLGASPLNDIGVYTVSFAQWIFRNEKPEKITATGKTVNQCDRWGTITLEYSGDRKAILIFGGVDFTPIDGRVTCERGRYDLPENFYCPTRVIRYENKGVIRCNQRKIEKVDFNFDNFENDKVEYNFMNDSGLRYEADHVYECLRDGKLESSNASHEDTLRIVQITDEARRQLGVVYSQDKE